ncbi:hypothetical protein ACIRO1_36550 [Streptomyces sp. NPDC102381]|uniref:hypothetical protein n=1 Tax=Streptomyces sp. NPDC102381 TaxID=3366164 RepID=UPI003816AA89
MSVGISAAEPDMEKVYMLDAPDGFIVFSMDDGEHTHAARQRDESTVCARPILDTTRISVRPHKLITCALCATSLAAKAARTQEATDMPTKKPDVDTMISDVHGVIDEIKAIDPKADDAKAQADSLKKKAETKIRALPTEHRNTLRTDLKAAHKAATTAPAIEPTAVATRAEVQAEDPRNFPGVKELIDQGIVEFREGLDLGLKLSNVGERLASTILEMRLAIPNPDADNLPDLMAGRKTTKNGAAEIYDAVRKTIAEDDVKRLDAHDSLVRAAQNKASDVLVPWLGGFDDEDDRAAQVERAEETFPGVSEYLSDDEPVSEAIRALYAAHEIALPRYGRTELARINRRVKKLGEATKALEAAQDAGDETEAENAAALVEELRAEIPDEFLEETPEKTPIERATDALDGVRSAFDKVATRAQDVKGAQKRKVKNDAAKLIQDFAARMGIDLSTLS